jgi:hypothetical protein
MATPKIKRGDTYPPLVMTLNSINNLGEEEAVDLTNVTEVRIIIKSSAEALVLEGVDVENAEAGEISYSWEDGDTDIAGTYQVEAEVEWPEGVQTFPNEGYSTLIITPDLGGIR